MAEEGDSGPIDSYGHNKATITYRATLSENDMKIIRTAIPQL